MARTNIRGRTILDEVYQHIYVGLSRPRVKLIILLHADQFNRLRLIGPLLKETLDMPGVRWIEADPAWVEA